MSRLKATSARKRPRGPALQARKVPRQERSQTMVAVILEAATRVLQQESLAGFNTNRVAQVAGISIGSLYQYFPNKAALMAALIERVQNDLAAAIETKVAALRGLGLHASLRALVALAVEQQYGDAVLAAALDHEEKRLPLEDRTGPAQQRMVAAVQSLLDAHLPGLPRTAAFDCLVITKALVEADAQRLRKPPADLPQRIVCALTGYLDRIGAA
jgi:AcrR family transcriptional regulator